MSYKLLLLLITVIGFLAVLFFWPQTTKLPQLGSIEDFQDIYTDDGKEFHLSSNKPKLITFFFSDCPDICPMTFLDLSVLQHKLAAEGVEENEYQIISITLDPEVDTPEKIANYKEQLNITSSNWHFLRASPEQTKKLTKSFNMVYKKDESGFITHSTTMYLVDSNNNIRAYHDMAVGEKTVDIDMLIMNIKKLLK